MKALSTWGSIRLWETRIERALHERYSLRSHGALIGILTLLLIWLVSTLLMRAGIDALALRYLVSLGAGYLAYLLMLRWWAHRLLRQIDGERANGNSSLDAPGDWLPGGSTGQGAATGHGPGAGTPPLRSGTGGDFGGGGASGSSAGQRPRIPSPPKRAIASFSKWLAMRWVPRPAPRRVRSWSCRWSLSFWPERSCCLVPAR